jgi:hypothetical protein
MVMRPSGTPGASPDQESRVTSPDPIVKPFGRLLGSWTTEATHPAMPGTVVHGTADIEWLEGEKFLIVRARTDHTDFPDSISIIGNTQSDRVDEATGTLAHAPVTPSLQMHYFDSRGVFRQYQVSIDPAAWRYWRDAPGFSQRFTGTFSGDGNTITGRSQLSKVEGRWDEDLAITYRRNRKPQLDGNAG